VGALDSRGRGCVVACGRSGSDLAEAPSQLTPSALARSRSCWASSWSIIETLDASDIGPTFRRAIAHPLRPDPDYTIFPTPPTLVGDDGERCRPKAGRFDTVARHCQHIRAAVKVFSCGALADVSTVANAVLGPVSMTGTMCLYSNVSTDVIRDLNGWIGVPAD
jgi:hypothetical protein